MKKLLTLLLALVFVFTFASCAKPDNNSDELVSKIIEGLKSEIKEEIKDELNVGNQTNNQSKLESDTQKPAESNTQNNQSGNESKALLTRDEVKAIALKQAKLKETDLFDLDIELDREFGAYLYEISFETREFEYEYDIDAQTGKIIKEHKEFND